MADLMGMRYSVAANAFHRPGELHDGMSYILDADTLERIDPTQYDIRCEVYFRAKGARTP